MDGRTYGHTDGGTDGHMRPILLGRLGKVDLIKADLWDLCSTFHGQDVNQPIVSKH